MVSPIWVREGESFLRVCERGLLFSIDPNHHTDRKQRQLAWGNQLDGHDQQECPTVCSLLAMMRSPKWGIQSFIVRTKLIRHLHIK